MVELKEQVVALYFYLSSAPEGLEKAEELGFYEGIAFLSVCTPAVVEAMVVHQEVRKEIKA